MTSRCVPGPRPWAAAGIRTTWRGWGGLPGGTRRSRRPARPTDHEPELRAFDRYGMRVDAVEYHPAYHELMDLAISNQVPQLRVAPRRRRGPRGASPL